MPPRQRHTPAFRGRPSQPLPRPRPVLLNEGVLASQRVPQRPDDTWQLPKGSKARILKEDISVIMQDTQTCITYSGPPLGMFYFWGRESNVVDAKARVIAVINDRNPTFKFVERIFGPDPDGDFESFGYFVWPSSRYPPEKTLGEPNFQRLNHIRAECSCAIVFDAKRSSFKVMGNTVNIQEALLRVRGALFQIIAGQLATNKLYLIHGSCQEIRLADYTHPRVIAGVAERAGSGKMYLAIGATSTPCHSLPNAKEIKNQVMGTLSKIRFYKGNPRMRVHLGTLLLKQYRMEKDRSSFPAYKEMISEPGFDAGITQELGNELFESQALSRIQEANGYFVSLSPFINELSEVKPVYSATITLDIQDGLGDLQITRTWQEEDSGRFNPTAAKFDRLDQRSARASFLEACMSDLEDGLTWQVGISATSSVDSMKLPTWIQDLATYHVNIDADAARPLKGRSQWCQFEKNEHGGPKPVARKKHLEQRTSWFFGIQQTDYVAEVAKIQNIRYNPGRAPGSELAIAQEPRWMIDVFNRQWERNFAENEGLQVGKGATWTADLQSWFPATADKGKGYVEMLQILKHVQDIITGKDSGR